MAMEPDKKKVGPSSKIIYSHNGRWNHVITYTRFRNVVLRRVPLHINRITASVR